MNSEIIAKHPMILTESIAGWIMAHRINQLTGYSTDLSHLRNGMHTLAETQIKILKDKINALVYDFYLKL